MPHYTRQMQQKSDVLDCIQTTMDKMYKKKKTVQIGLLLPARFVSPLNLSIKGLRVNEFILFPDCFHSPFVFQNKLSIQSNLFTVCKINFAPLQIELEFPVGRSIMVSMMRTPQAEGKREEKTRVRAVGGIFGAEGVVDWKCGGGGCKKGQRNSPKHPSPRLTNFLPTFPRQGR